jgi:hypothetical protein
MVAMAQNDPVRGMPGLAMFKSLICSLCLGLASFTAAADGGAPPREIDDGDVRGVRAVVEAQLKALAEGNAKLAFSFASPSIKGQFHDADRFFEMVRGSYPMLIRPASVSFYRPELTQGVVTQPVQFRDREGHTWRAVYELQRQPDKTWRINGCAVAPDDDASTTT